MYKKDTNYVGDARALCFGATAKRLAATVIASKFLLNNDLLHNITLIVIC